MSRLLKLFVVLCLLAAVMVLSACQPALVFVVANESNDRIYVRYVVKNPNQSGPLPYLPEAPAVKLVSELSEQTAWVELPETRFTFTPETRTVVIPLMPKEALRVERTNYPCDEDDSKRTEDFMVEEINIIGPSGAIRLTGEQARRSFVSGPRGICALTYR